ncbi:hypothetical protein [Anabaena sp. UHCC 0451]|nr:hypothetical protein [Anabaena sp. UHCC 0451]MEA5575582.1 hypothetical protein [Anabaena sp. UHCC 0451]
MSKAFLSKIIPEPKGFMKVDTLGLFLRFLVTELNIYPLERRFSNAR